MWTVVIYFEYDVARNRLNYQRMVGIIHNNKA